MSVLYAYWFTLEKFTISFVKEIDFDCEMFPNESYWIVPGTIQVD